jgi:Flp pilus assembly protein TadD
MGGVEFMREGRKKWLILGAVIVVIAAGSVFLTTVATRTNSSASSTGASPAPTENPDHELKALAVELEKKPGHTPILMRMADLEHGKGKLDDAIQHMQQAVQSEPANKEARLELGRLLYEKGDIGGAITETEKILASDPGQVDALYNLGAIYANLGNNERAKSYWIRAAKVGGDADSGRKAREALTKLGGS